MVWIHGGAFMRGSGALPTYDGSRFARDGRGLRHDQLPAGCGRLSLPGRRGREPRVARPDRRAGMGGRRTSKPLAGTLLGSRFSVSRRARSAWPRCSRCHARRPVPTGDRAEWRLAAHELGGNRPAGREQPGDKLGVAPTMASIAEVPLERLVWAQAELAVELAVRPDPARWRGGANGWPSNQSWTGRWCRVGQSSASSQRRC